MILPPFWWNSPGTLPGLGPMSSPEYFLPPIPISNLGPTLTWAHVSSIGYFLPYNTHTERCNKYKVLTWHRNAANIQSKRLPYLYQKGTRHDKNRTVRYMNETNPLFGEIVLGPSLARAQWPPLIFPSSQPHSDRDPPWPGPIFLPGVFPSLCQRYRNTEMKFYEY